MKTSIRRVLSAAVAFALLCNLFAAAAFAKSSRTALITDVNGDVTVTKGGGSNPIPAFPNMPLNQGDSIETGDDGSVTVKIADPESERTIGPNSNVSISELSESGSGKKSGFKVFVGSVWNKVKSLASGDEDGIETPTATMGVRGTRYLVIAKPDGTLSVVVASGLVAAKLSGGQVGNSEGTSSSPDNTQKPDSKTVLLAPTQQIDLNPSAPPSNLSNAVRIADVSSIVKQSDPSIIKAFIIDAPSIAAENKELLANLKNSLQNGGKPVLERGGAVSDLSIGSLDDLNKVSQNMNNLVSNIAANAVSLGKVDSSELAKLIEQANNNISDVDAKIDLKKKPIDPTAGVDPEQAKKKQDEQDRINQLLQRQQLDRQLQASEIARQLSELLSKVAVQQKKVSEENQKAESELTKAAENTYVSGLSDAEKQEFNKNKDALDSNVTPTTSGGTSGNEPGSGDQTVPTTVVLNQTKTSDGFDLEISLKGFTGTKRIYGAELHFLSDTEATVTKKSLNVSKFPDSNSADIVKASAGIVDGASKLETIFAVTHYNTEAPVEFSDAGEQLATLHFAVNPAAFSYKLAYVLLVDAGGNEVPVAVKPTETFTYTK